MTDETDQPCHGFICDGCGEEQAPYAYRLWAAVFAPADTSSSASRQHYIETGRYLAVGQVSA